MAAGPISGNFIPAKQILSEKGNGNWYYRVKKYNNENTACQNIWDAFKENYQRKIY